MKERRGFALCLDGENLELLEEFCGEFDLPNLSGLLERGRRGRLDPWINPLTPPSWTTFQTGTWFTRHGVLGFVQHDPDVHRDVLVRASQIRGESFLAAADRQGVPVISLNLPMTFPPPRLTHGAVVSGFETPNDESDYAWPPDLKDLLRGSIPGYTPCHPSGNPDGRRREARMDLLEVLEHHVRLRESALELMLGKYSPRIAVVQCQETDLLHHVAWDLVSDLGSALPRERKALRGIYEGVDRLAGILMRHAGDDGLGLIVSDHGGAPGRWLVQVNNLLARWGLAVPLDGADGTLARHDEVGRSLKARLTRRIRRITGNMLDEPTARRGDEVNRELQLDWSRTRAFLGVGYHLGLVYGGDGEPLSRPELDDLRRRFLDFRLGDGTAAFDDVLLGGDLFKAAPPGGMYRPLLGLVAADGVYLGRRTGGAVEIAMDHPSRGLHRRYGMFCWHGEGVAGGVADEPMPMTAVYPTLFTALGLLVPDDLDGEADPMVTGGRSSGILNPAKGTENPDQGDDGDDESALRERLEGLGYV